MGQAEVPAEPRPHGRQRLLPLARRRADGGIIRLEGDVETVGASLRAPGRACAPVPRLPALEPVPPTTARTLAEVGAGLCLLLRDEVTEQLALRIPALTGLADDWCLPAVFWRHEQAVRR